MTLSSLTCCFGRPTTHLGSSSFRKREVTIACEWPGRRQFERRVKASTFPHGHDPFQHRSHRNSDSPRRHPSLSLHSALAASLTHTALLLLDRFYCDALHHRFAAILVGRCYRVRGSCNSNSGSRKTHRVFPFFRKRWLEHRADLLSS